MSASVYIKQTSQAQHQCNTPNTANLTFNTAKIASTTFSNAITPPSNACSVFRSHVQHNYAHRAIAIKIPATNIASSVTITSPCNNLLAWQVVIAPPYSAFSTRGFWLRGVHANVRVCDVMTFSRGILGDVIIMFARKDFMLTWWLIVIPPHPACFPAWVFVCEGSTRLFQLPRD